VDARTDSGPEPRFHPQAIDGHVLNDAACAHFMFVISPDKMTGPAYGETRLTPAIAATERGGVAGQIA
jgi:hypothetical protein